MENSSKIQSQFIAIPETEAILPPLRSWRAFLQQCLRFGLVGILNAGIDLLVFNMLIWLLPTHDANLLSLFNVFAYGLGAANSFILNRYWTFRQRQQAKGNQALRFAIVTVVGICCNSAIVWLVFQALQPLAINIFILANVAKIAAIAVTAALSFLSMRFWVFAASAQNKYEALYPKDHALGMYEAGK